MKYIKFIGFVSVFLFLSVILLKINCHDCMLGGSLVGFIARVPLLLQMVSFFLLISALFMVAFKANQRRLKIYFPLLTGALILFTLSTHVAVDSIIQEEYRDTWFGFTFDKVRSSPADPVYICSYSYPFIMVKDDWGKAMNIFVGVYPFVIDVDAIMKRCGKNV